MLDTMIKIKKKTSIKDYYYTLSPRSFGPILFQTSTTMKLLQTRCSRAGVSITGAT